MKRKVSLILFFVLSYFHAQEILDKDAFKKCKKEFSKKICLSDEDKDGILFYLDQCPKEIGAAENKGCPWPDSDGDGIFDKDDICPTISGPIENNGCPWADTDGDGILDKDDACPTVPGVVEANGCPQADCKKFYEEGKIRLKKFQDEAKSVDYEKLIDLILDGIDLKMLPSNNLIVFKELRMLECGTGWDKYCHHQYNFNTPIFSTVDFWKEKTILKLYDKIKKNLILALQYNGMGSGVKFDEKAILDKKYQRVKVFCRGDKDAIMYPRFAKIPLAIKDYSTLLIDINKNELENKVEVTIGYTNIKILNKELGNISRKNYIYLKTYQYINNQWVLIETKKEN